MKFIIGNCLYLGVIKIFSITSDVKHFKGITSPYTKSYSLIKKCRKKYTLQVGIFQSRNRESWKVFNENAFINRFVCLIWWCFLLNILMFTLQCPNAGNTKTKHFLSHLISELYFGYAVLLVKLAFVLNIAMYYNINKFNKRSHSKIFNQ